MELQYRHEFKHYIGEAEAMILRSRLRAMMKPDDHGGNGGIYRVRSLYFDNLYDKALREKIDGVNRREKYRIRMYDKDTSFIRLEKKIRRGSLNNKQSARISAEAVRNILQGNIQYDLNEVQGHCDFETNGEQMVLLEFLYKMKTEMLRPMAVVDYRREAYVFAPGNVRVTLDSDIKTSIKATDFLNPEMPLAPAGHAGVGESAVGPVHILEVKYDNFLPSVVRDIVQLGTTRQTAFSKYAAARVYG